MRPEDVTARFSLDHGSAQPALSLYFDVGADDGLPRARHSRIDRVAIAANLRHAQYDVLNVAFDTGSVAGSAYEAELRELWRLACALERRRGRPSTGAAFLDYSFYVEGER